MRRDLRGAADGDGERGFALLIVLWTLTLLALLTSGLTASGRGEARLARNLRDETVAEAAADGAAQEAIFRLVAGQWSPGPLPHELRIGSAVTSIRLQDEADLVNPNDAPVVLLAALLREVGADVATAQIVANEIDEFHSQGGADPAAYIIAGLPYGPGLQPFRDVNELGLVPGMTPELLGRLAPHLSVWKLPMVVPDAFDPVVATAFREAGPNGGFQFGNPGRLSRQEAEHLFVRITVTAHSGGARFDRVVEVQVFGQPNGIPRPAPYQIMSWSGPAN